MSTTADLPRVVGRYELLDVLGQGASGKVFRARHLDLGRLVAFKEFELRASADPVAIKRFMREGRLASTLDHPNVVAIYDWFQDEQRCALAMEFVPGGPLGRYIGRLTLAQVIGILAGMLGGLAHAHAQGVMHRDIKPENVLISRGGLVKLADFGIAKALSTLPQGTVLTRLGLTLGTAAYMAPEQALAEDIGTASDIYGAGCVACELLTMNPPYGHGDEPMKLLIRHVNDPVPNLAKLRPDLDPRIARWVESLLAKDASARPSAADARSQLVTLATEMLGPDWSTAAAIEGRLPVVVSLPAMPTETGETPAIEREAQIVEGGTVAVLQRGGGQVETFQLRAGRLRGKCGGDDWGDIGGWRGAGVGIAAAAAWEGDADLFLLRADGSVLYAGRHGDAAWPERFASLGRPFRTSRAVSIAASGGGGRLDVCVADDAGSVRRARFLAGQWLLDGDHDGWHEL